MEREQVQIGLRVSEGLNDQLDAKAKEIGISKNALVSVLIHLGFKFMDYKIDFTLPDV